MAAVRWETEVQPNGVKRFVRVPEVAPPPPPPPPARPEVELALVALQADAETAAAQLRDIRQRIGALVADARHREALRRRLEHHSQQEAQRRAREALRGVTGERVARARFLAGVSQREVALAWGISRGGLAETERGKRPVHEGVGRWARQVLRASGEWEEPAS